MASILVPESSSSSSSQQLRREAVDQSMASCLPLSFLFLVLLLCHGSMAQYFGSSSSPWQSSRHGVQSSEQCRLERLSALQPKRKVESEGGVTEYFDENNEQFNCAGVAANRRTIEPKGLLLPFYSNAHRLVYILQGSGIIGGVLPGCPETYQSFDQQSERQQQDQQEQGKGQQQKEQGQQQQGEGRQGQQQQGQQHQRIIRFRQGDIIAVPAGIAQWTYNDGDKQIIAITVLDTSSNANQLDNNPRKFSLAGQSSKQVERSTNNIFSGFDLELLANSLGVSREMAQKLQKGQEGEIVKVERGLQILMPQRGSEEEQEQSQRGSQSSNGLEQAFCTLRFRENINEPSGADIYNPQAGWYSHLNGQKLPILNFIQMSATRGVLYNDATLAPHWNINAHSLVYVTGGRGRVQIVGDQGQSVFDDELRQGQLVIVPQHYVAVMQARAERFEWIAFKTNGNAIVNQIVGQGSFFRGVPEDVIAESYQGLSRGEARVLKKSVSLVVPRSSRTIEQVV